MRLIKIRILLWVILLLVVIWLLWQAIVPGGQAIYQQDFSDFNYFISELTPAERIIKGEDGAFVVGDPVYFSLFTPRHFDQAELLFTFRRLPDTPETASIIEAGVLADKILWRYNLKPLDNNIINQLALAWPVIKEDNLLFLQREVNDDTEAIRKFNNLEEFLAALPPQSEVALYNYQISKEYLLPDYEKDEKEKEINYSLRGPFQFYTYIKDEDLYFNFSLEDLNQNEDSDPIELHVYYQDGLIAARTLPDDGVSTDSGKATPARLLELKLADLPEGVYKVELKVNNDIITSKITTYQEKLSFVNKVWLTGGRGGINIYTDSREIQAQTIEPSGLQSISAGNGNLEINETYKQFQLKLNEENKNAGNLTNLQLAKGAVILSGDGVFSFTEEAFLNPAWPRADNNININNGKINYVLADYSFPEEEGGWYTARAKFNLANAYREKGKYNFIISIPGLRADDEIEDRVEIKEIKFILTGKSLWQKIKEIIKR